MTPEEELSEALSGKYRAILISSTDIDLRPASPPNRIFMLKIAEGSLASGGRGGGFGERKVVRVSEFVLEGGAWSRPFESEDEAVVSRFEIPYYVSRIPLILSDGTESMGYGVVEAPLVADFASKKPA